MEGWKEPKLEVSPWLIIAETAAGKEGRARKEERGWNIHKIWFWIADLRPGFWWCFYTWVIKRKGFTRWQEAAICSLQKRIAGVFCIPALPCPSSLPDPGNGSSSSKEKSSLFTSLTHLCLVAPGSGTKWRAFCVLLAIGIEKNAFFWISWSWQVAGSQAWKQR